MRSIVSKVFGFLLAATVRVSTAFIIPWSAPTNPHLGSASKSTILTRCYSSSSTDPNAYQYQTGEPFPFATEVFQGAVNYNEMLGYLTEQLIQSAGYEIPQTFCGTSLCGDEMNRPLEQALSQIFAENYSLGGLAGCPFGGVTSFKKMKSHIPDGGSALIVYGPHVGMSLDGRIGHVDRAQIQAQEGDHTMCCRSAILAADHVSQVLRGEAESMPMDLMDASQYFVGNMLMPYAERLEQHPDANTKMVDLPYALFEAQTEMMYQIIQEGSQAGFPGSVAVLGGIQINTPPGYLDYYLPLRFDLYNAEGEYIANLFEGPPSGS